MAGSLSSGRRIPVLNRGREITDGEAGTRPDPRRSLRWGEGAAERLTGQVMWSGWVIPASPCGEVPGVCLRKIGHRPSGISRLIDEPDVGGAAPQILALSAKVWAVSATLRRGIQLSRAWFVLLGLQVGASCADVMSLEQECILSI
jgi:hypothetical protein